MMKFSLIALTFLASLFATPGQCNDRIQTIFKGDVVSVRCLRKSEFTISLSGVNILLRRIIAEKVMYELSVFEKGELTTLVSCNNGFLLEK